MFWFVYNCVFAVGYLLLVPNYLLRMKRRGGYRKGFLERFAVYPESIREILGDRPRIWIHGVSVGEIYVVLRFVEEFRRMDPDVRFVISTTTSTGHAIAEEQMDERDVLLYFPADFPGIVKRALDIIAPHALLLAESELWPNMIRSCSDREIPVVLVNGRISDASYRGYKKVRAIVRRVLRCVSLLMVQSEQDRERVVALGADAQRVLVMGSTKYDMTGASDEGLSAARATLQQARIDPDGMILLGGSTWAGEESELLDSFVALRQQFKDLKLVLVPRHMERRAEVEAEIQKRSLKYIKRSTMSADCNSAGEGETDVLLVDTTGELKDFYGCASVIFVGKSLTNHGGQNILEPALLGKPIIVGPNMENFPAIIEDFRSADAIMQVEDGAALKVAIAELLGSAELRQKMGDNARDLVDRKKGVVTRSVARIRELIGR